jgi:preprotein translocase subunit SecG
MAVFVMLVLVFVSVILIAVVLLQRGRGGGLAGAFGGMGGQSAFGTKAGDVFTKITIGLVAVWVVLAGVSGILARRDSGGDFQNERQQAGEDAGDTIGTAADEGDESSGDAASGDAASGDAASGDESSGDESSGDESTGGAASEESSGKGSAGGSEPETSGEAETPSE